MPELRGLSSKIKFSLLIKRKLVVTSATAIEY